MFTMGTFTMSTFQGNFEEDKDEVSSQADELGESRSRSQKLGEIIDTEEARLGEEAQLSSRLQAQAFAKKFTSEGLTQVMDFIRQEVKVRTKARTPIKARTKAHKSNCRTVCTAKCAKEHNSKGGKKYPVCDLPYSVLSYLSPEETRANSITHHATRCASVKKNFKLWKNYQCTSCYEDNRCHETEETGTPNNQLGESASTKPPAAVDEAGVRGRRWRGHRRFQRHRFQRHRFQRHRFQRL